MPKPKPKPRIGRPPVAEELRRDKVVKVLVTAAELDELQQAAAATRSTVSSYVSAAALEKARGA